MALQKIQGSTPIHSFPDIHNQNVEELQSEITRLEGIISQQTQEINNLKNKFNSAITALRAEYMRLIDEVKNNQQ